MVFGMEDGTVSIFGLVFAVAVSAQDSHAVLLAGATGAVAAAVSMMAGTFLDVTWSRPPDSVTRTLDGGSRADVQGRLPVMVWASWVRDTTPTLRNTFRRW